MEYYNLYKKDLVVRVDDERNAEFTGKLPLMKRVAQFESRAETLKNYDAKEPVYTEENLKLFFPKTKKMNLKNYDSAVKSINEYNSAQKVLRLELDALSMDDMEDYVEEFPMNHPRLASFADINTLLEMALFVSSGGQNPLTGTVSEAAERKAAEQVYSILKSAEKSKSSKVVKRLVKLSQNTFNGPAYGSAPAMPEQGAEDNENQMTAEVSDG